CRYRHGESLSTPCWERTKGVRAGPYRRGLLFYLFEQHADLVVDALEETCLGDVAENIQGFLPQQLAIQRQGYRAYFGTLLQGGDKRLRVLSHGLDLRTLAARHGNPCRRRRTQTHGFDLAFPYTGI